MFRIGDVTDVVGYRASIGGGGEEQSARRSDVVLKVLLLPVVCMFV